jgi:hypothetical protein
MVSHDDGTGPRLYVGGMFTRAGGLVGVDANNIACWDGTEWSALGTGSNDRVLHFGSLIDAGGRHLVAAGEFTVIGGKFLSGVARWDGAEWVDVEGVNGAAAIRPVVINDEPFLAINAGENGVGLWNSVRGWNLLGDVRRGDQPGIVLAIEQLGGSGGDLWFGGDFDTAGGQPAGRLAAWSPRCACLADCDGDGILDFFDFLCFQTAFGLGDPSADCDANGVLDFFDFLCFQTAFGKGCR